MGQYNPVVLSGEGRGDGGRRVSQKNELLFRMLNVRISVVENKVAKKLLRQLGGDQMGWTERWLWHAPKSELVLAVPSIG